MGDFLLILAIFNFKTKVLILFGLGKSVLLQLLDTVLFVTSIYLKYIDFFNVIRNRQRQIGTHFRLITKIIKILVSRNTARHFREKRARVLRFLELSDTNEYYSVLIRTE